MKGKVRSNERHCPEGHGRLKIIEEIDIKCVVCNYRPKTFFIDLYNCGRHRIARGKDGEILTSYRQAHRLLENIRFEIDARVFSISRYMPKQIEEFKGKNLIEKWLMTKTNIAPSTMREYRRYADLYFIPFFGGLDMRDTNTGTIEDFFQFIPERQQKLERKKLSQKTLKNISITLHNFTAWLFRRETIARMPEFPQISPPEPVIECISREDQIKIISKMHPHHQPVITFLVYHPVRPGEARALRRKHFNLQDMTVQISESWSLKEIHHRKNKRGYYLPVSQHFDISILADKLPEAFVFVNKAGRPYTNEGLRRIWHKARALAGVSNIKLYNGTRHSTATDTLRKTGSLYITQKMLDHTSAKMTEKYARMNVEILRGATDDSIATTTRVRQKARND